MTMVDLMGGKFSKPLVAKRVTHLICYKFEGEKYELAKRNKNIKLVNHRWLEDCLKNWKLLPEVGYEIRGCELEMMEAILEKANEVESNLTEHVNRKPIEGLQSPNVYKKDIVPFKKGHWYGMGYASECIATFRSQLQSTHKELDAIKKMVTQQKIDFEAQITSMKEENDKRFKAFEERFFSSN